MNDPFDASLDLLRRLDPKHVLRNLTNLCRLAPSIAEDLLSSVDQPLETRKCEESGKSYLICDYNRDGDLYRSPWSNKYYPALLAEEAELAPKPLNDLRELEIFANELFDIYRDLYYEGGFCSVYMWNPSEDPEGDPNDVSQGFACAILLKKESGSSSVWDSVHVVNVERVGELYDYVLTSTIMLNMESTDDFQLSLLGNLTRQQDKKMAAKSHVDHIANIGGMVEDMESKMRNLMQEVYFGKTADVVGDLRTVGKMSAMAQERELQGSVIKGLSGA